MERPKLSKMMDKKITRSLPITNSDLTIRLCTRSDLDILSRWPDYSWPFESFRLSFAGKSKDKLDEVFNKRSKDRTRISMVCDYKKEKAVGYFALLYIDWEKYVSENMSIRLHPDLCNKNIGTKSYLQLELFNWFERIKT